MLSWLHLSCVHFAMALLLSGLVFDALGLFKKLERLLFVGFWNTLLGAIATIAAIGTGYASELGLGAHSELGSAWLRFHKFAALIVAVCAVLMAGARLAMRGGILPRTRTLYLAVGFFSAVLLLGSSIIGAALVHSYGLGIDRDTAQRVILAQPDAPLPARAAGKTP